jgi:hypothetical protein
MSKVSAEKQCASKVSAEKQRASTISAEKNVHQKSALKSATLHCAMLYFSALKASIFSGFKFPSGSDCIILTFVHL